MVALREPVRYCDAIRLLGADDPDVVDLIDRLVADEATDLLAARTDLVGFAHQALNRLDRESHLLSRVERTRFIAAAHSVVVVTAFFESLDDTELPFRLDNGLDDAAAGVADRLMVVGDGAAALAEGALEAGLEPERVERAADRDEALELLLAELREGDTVLVKASRGAALDLLVEQLVLAADEATNGARA